MATSIATIINRSFLIAANSVFNLLSVVNKLPRPNGSAAIITTLLSYSITKHIGATRGGSSCCTSVRITMSGDRIAKHVGATRGGSSCCTSVRITMSGDRIAKHVGATRGGSSRCTSVRITMSGEQNCRLLRELQKVRTFSY